MRVTMSTVLKALAALPLLAASSLSVYAEDDAESLLRAGRLGEKRDHAADSDADKRHSASRQGYGHVRQGNTSSGPDAYGRPYAPYSGESAEQVMSRAFDSSQLPSWELGVEVTEPRSMQVMGADGQAKTVWYVLYKVANRNAQPIYEYKTGVVEVTKTPSSGDAENAKTIEETGLKVDGAGEAAGGMIANSFLVPVARETGQWQGMPVNTSISVHIETISGYNALADKDDDLRTMIAAQVDKTGEADDTRRAQMIADLYAKARKVYRDSADADLRRQIAEKEGLMEWRDSKFEPAIWSSDAFKRDVSPVYNLTGTRLDGVRALPRVIESMNADGTIATKFAWPAVSSSDQTFYDFIEDGKPTPDGVTIVRESHELYGKLLPTAYQEYDVVDRFGRVLGPSDAGYHAARAAGGEITRSKDDAGIAANLDELIGTPAKRPAYRIYQAGDKVTKNWNTGVPTSPGSTDTFRINGKLITSPEAAQRAFQSVLAELKTHARGTGATAVSSVAGADLEAAAKASMASATVELDGNTEIFNGRSISDQIPVKQLDHLGRAIRRQLVTYQVGETVTKAEYDAWAQRFPASVLARYTGQPWTRPLRAGDLLVDLPKIKMGRLLSDEKGTPESVEINGRPVLTGNPYSSLTITPTDFARDPDGEYFTWREAPIPSSVSLQPGEDYVYAPLGQANSGASPVPAFDSYGVWADYLDPVTGQRVPLKNANGEPVVDEMGQQLYVKEYEYEWLYAYEYVRETETDEGFAAQYNGSVNGFVQGDLDVFMKDGKFVGPAVWQVWEGTGDSRRFVRYSMSDPGSSVDSVSPSQFIEANPGYTVETIKAPLYVIENLTRGLEGQNSTLPPERLEARHFKSNETSFSNGWAPNDTIATSQRWTLPPPLVSQAANGDLIVESSVKLTIGPSGEKVHHHFVSERWGVFILPDVADDWDFMNVSIRGLRSPIIRRGFSDVSYEVPAPGMNAPMRRTALNANYVRQDWVYHARFERQGNPATPATNNVLRINEGWRLMNENPVE